jgi:hypothetical protein
MKIDEFNALAQAGYSVMLVLSQLWTWAEKALALFRTWTLKTPVRLDFPFLLNYNVVPFQLA